MNKILYIDMDDTICDFKKHFFKIRKEMPYVTYPQSTKNFFKNIPPIPGAVESVKALSEFFDIYFLTAPSVMNPYSYTDKRLWIEYYFGIDACHKLIITPHKNLNKGDFLIDDMKKGKGQDLFEGELITYGSKEFPEWNSIVAYLVTKI